MLQTVQALYLCRLVGEPHRGLTAEPASCALRETAAAHCSARPGLTRCGVGYRLLAMTLGTPTRDTVREPNDHRRLPRGEPICRLPRVGADIYKECRGALGRSSKTASSSSSSRPPPVVPIDA